MAEKSSTSFRSSGGVKFEVKPFDGKSNFTLWQRKIKNILIQHDLYFTISGVEFKPTDIAKGTWEKLEKLYMRKSLSNKLTLKDQLYGLKMEESGDVKAHLNDFNRCISDLIRVNVKYEKDDKALLLLRSLSDSFKHFKTTLLFGKDTLEYDTVVSDIISYVKMNKASERES
ncbi:hypothetical protein JRO89_XS09G0151200 [Xanthoceras sorbifolium]|uniref:Retrovirus-related Pol polyprotein from transposon TNT 1-94 n=1 Tax=Xanthoceras sorbifolium TaxID=99658 RepID=A0ABQ8HLM5_9ROSI|nr:hypothetical protein JRO89_XS09G0151200 [Xanthoceras sorbifolium]